VYLGGALERGHRARASPQDGHQEVVTGAGFAIGSPQYPACGTVPPPGSDPAFDLLAAEAGSQGLADTEKSVVDSEFWIEREHWLSVVRRSTAQPPANGICG
jgi:hypothetical protein